MFYNIYIFIAFFVLWTFIQGFSVFVHFSILAAVLCIADLHLIHFLDVLLLFLTALDIYTYLKIVKKQILIFRIV